MWTLDQEAPAGRKRGERVRGTPRRRSERAAALDRELERERERERDWVRRRVRPRGHRPPEPDDWSEVEAVIFGPPGGGRAVGLPAHEAFSPPAHARDTAGAAPRPGRSGWLVAGPVRGVGRKGNGGGGHAAAPAGPPAPVPLLAPGAPDLPSRVPAAGSSDAQESGPSTAPCVDVVGVREPLLGHVLAALLAAGLRARCFPDGGTFAARPGHPAERSNERSGRSPADRPSGYLQRREAASHVGGVVWAAEEPDPPPGAVLIGADGPAAWAVAARHPEHPHVTLPSGAAWLGARLSARSRRGVVVAVGGLGGAGGSQRAALALAYAAESEGLPVVLVDADPGSVQRWEAEPGVPGWETARRWAADGSVAGLPELLVSDGAIARLGWAPGEDPDRLPPAEVAAVCGALASTFELVIVAVGALEWPLAAVPAGAAHVLACAGEDGSWPPHRCTGATVSLSVLRGRGRSPDGPALAGWVGAAWAGSAADPSGPEPGRALRRLARRLWLPRLLAGAGPGAP